MQRAAILFFTMTLAGLTAAESARAEDGSLYDAKHARSTTADVQHFLGPKAGSLHYDARMIRAAQIAMDRSFSHPTWRCWHFVKDALVAARVIDSRPSSPWAKMAGDELCRRYGFMRLAKVRNPMQAPVGAVLVYGGPDAGHVEIRTSTGFVSDFRSATPYPRPFLGAYVKPV